VEEYDPAKDLQREKNIELSISKLAYRRGHWTWRLWLNHWKNICFYSFTLYLSLPFYFLLWPLKFELGHQIFVVGGHQDQNPTFRPPKKNMCRWPYLTLSDFMLSYFGFLLLKDFY
jgi:hypothetical protein